MMHNVEPDPTKLLQAIIRLRIGLTPLSEAIFHERNLDASKS